MPGTRALAPPLRLGILGAARIVHHALVAPAASLSGEVELEAIAARQPERAREMATRFGIRRALERYEDVLEDPGVDAVYVALPTALHASWAQRALRQGKHVLCEKPLAANAREARALAVEAKRSGRVLLEALHYRHHPLASAILEGRAQLGALREMRLSIGVPFPMSDIRHQFAMAGGATLDLGVYAVDLLRWIEPGPVEVTRASARISAPGVDESMEFELQIGQVPARVRVSIAESEPLFADLEISAQEGSMQVLNPFAPDLFHSLELKVRKRRTSQHSPRTPSYVYQLRDFARGVRGEGGFQRELPESVENLRVLDAVYARAGLPLRGASRVTAPPTGSAGAPRPR